MHKSTEDHDERLYKYTVQGPHDACCSYPLERYNEVRERAGDAAFYATAHSVVHGVHTDRKEAIDKMALDVQVQAEKREKFSRRRRHDADVDYINERNMKFNKKLERFYGDYTKDIKDNLERGTAV